MSASGTKPGHDQMQPAAKMNRSERQGATTRARSSYAIDTARRCVVVSFTATLAFDDIEQYASHLRRDPRFDPGFSEIVDLRGVDNVVLNPKELTRLADRVDPFELRSKRAFVVQSQGQIHAAHIHRILRPNSSNIRVFVSMDEANDWIGADTLRAEISRCGR
jgi:hypothetical protein